jgi:hypothetical protein
MNPKLHIMGILLTMVDYTTTYANDITEILFDAAVGILLRLSALDSKLGVHLIIHALFIFVVVTGK